MFSTRSRHVYILNLRVNANANALLKLISRSHFKINLHYNKRAKQGRPFCHICLCTSVLSVYYRKQALSNDLLLVIVKQFYFITCNLQIILKFSFTCIPNVLFVPSKFIKHHSPCPYNGIHILTYSHCHLDTCQLTPLLGLS